MFLLCHFIISFLFLNSLLKYNYVFNFWQKTKGAAEIGSYLHYISTPLTSTVVTITIVFTTKGDFFSSESRPFTLTVQKQFVTPSGDGGCSFRWSVPFLTKIRKKYRKILYKRLKNIRVENSLPLCVDLGTH